MAYKKLKYYFDKDLAKLLSKKITECYPEFKQQKFVLQISKEVESLELKDRVATIAQALKIYLPPNYPKALAILMQILGPENPKETGMFIEGYWLMPIASFVEQYGLDHFDISTAAIKEITKRNTGEYAIRPYIRKAPKKTLKLLKTWAKSKNFHVRRLACEGTRPRLPWATKLDIFIEAPKPILPILNQLKADTSLYVRKSVANNLNDILKDNYDIAMALIQEWRKLPLKKETAWIIKHALRNQLKKENPVAIDIVAKLSSVNL